jgi:branched-chain amino acid transport system ATP-binding protein
VAHVPENRGVLHQLTVRENLGLSLDKQGLEVAFDLFPELVPLASRRAGLLSGGEQQMLALGRALASRPSLLLLDEMSLGLAPVIVDRLLPFARRAADEGAGVVLVEQHTDRALSISDRAYVLVHGEVVLSGPAQELMDQQHLLDAAFFGYTEE